MNTQFTKGPWKYQKPFNKVTIYSANHPEGNVCFFHPDDKMADKNALLISAAPEMYEALKLLQSALTEYELLDVKKRYSLCVADAAASKALAAAEGRK